MSKKKSFPFEIMENKNYELNETTTLMINSWAKSSFSEEKLSKKEIRYFSLRIRIAKLAIATVIIGIAMMMLSFVALIFLGDAIDEILNAYIFLVFIISILSVPFIICIILPSIKTWQSLTQGSLQVDNLIDDTFTFSGCQSLKFNTKNWKILNIFKINNYYICQGIVTDYKLPFRHVETVYIPIEILTINEEEKIQKTQKSLTNYRRNN